MNATPMRIAILRPALERPAALVIQPRRIATHSGMNLSRHSEFALQLLVRHQLLLQRSHVLSVIIDLRDNQKACPGSLARDGESVTPEAQACK